MLILYVMNVRESFSSQKLKDADSSKHDPSRGAYEPVDPWSVCWLAPSGGHGFLFTTG